MPNVTSQNLFAVLPSMINIIRGQATSAKVTLHKNYVGNALPIAMQNNVIVEYINSDNVVFKTESVTPIPSSLIYGTGELANQISIEVTAQESAALNFSASGIQGELYIRISITQASQTVVLPKLKVGNVYDAGDQIGDIVASRFTVPSTVYKIKALDNYAATMPGAGEMIFNSATPASITMVKISNQDDKGFKNKWLETVLNDRIGVDGLTNSIFLPETSFHTFNLTPMDDIGVKESTSSSLSIFLRERLSTIRTSCPFLDKCKAVGQPQNPSPPSTITFLFFIF